MRIQRPAIFIAKQLTASALRMTASVTLVISVLTGGVIFGQNILHSPQQAKAATPPDSCFAFDSGTGMITDYYSNEGNNDTNPECTKVVDIPSTIGGVAVTQLGGESNPYTFSNKGITAITIPNSVTSIGDYAFSYNQLTSITIPNSVTSIGTVAFGYNHITNVAFQGLVTTFGHYIFTDNPVDSLTYDGITYSSSQQNGEQCYSFNSETGLISGFNYAEMNIVQSNGGACLSLNLSIPSTIGGVAVTKIDDYAFPRLHFSSLTIPNSVTSIGNSAFSGNYLSSLTIPNSVTSIGNSAFSSNHLTSVIIPNSITNISDSLFYGNQLTSITIPNGVTSIGAFTFAENQLTSITIPNSVTSIGNGSFGDNHLTSVTIPNGVTSIGAFTYSGNQLTSITIPNSVTSIGDSSLANNQLTSITIPNSVTSIGDSSLADNHLTSVTIPNSVTIIGDSAFKDNYLTNLVLSNHMTTIPNQAFAFNKLTSVILPASVTGIMPAAFIGQNPIGKGILSSEDSTLDLYSLDPVVALTAYNSIWYVRLYTVDPTNPAGLSDGFSRAVGWSGSFYGSSDDSYGGHLINPASTTVNYTSKEGIELQSSQTVTGQLTSGAILSNYTLANSPSMPIVVDASAPTHAEQLAINQSLSVYARMGQTKQFIAPAISDYALISPATPASKTLTSQVNNLNFIYAKNISTIDFAQPSGSTTNPTSDSVPVQAPILLGGSTFALDTSKPCSIIKSAKILPSSNFVAPTSNYTTLGGLDFVLLCTEAGKDAKVSLTLAGTLPNLSLAKVYKKTETGSIDITNLVTFTNQSTSSGAKTVLSYSLTDGGALDEDGTVNSTITDPIYITIPVSGTASVGLLAATGSSARLYINIAVIFVLLSIIGGLSLIHTKKYKK